MMNLEENKNILYNIMEKDNIIKNLVNLGVDFKQKMTTYKYKVCMALLKEHHNIEISYDEIVKIIDEYKNTGNIQNNISIDNESLENNSSKPDELDELSKIIDGDESIPESDWKQYLDWKNNKALWKLDKDGEKTSLVECIQNIVGFFNNFPKYKNKIYYNTIRGYAELDGEQITDDDIYKAIVILNKYMLPYYSSIRGVRDAIMTIAYNNEKNILKTWFEDNYKKYYDPDNDYIDILLENILRCEDLDKYKDLYYAEIKMHLLASLKKMCYANTEAEYKYDNILVLCSVQGGTGKTSFCEYLYTFDSICYANIWEPESINFSNKDFLEQLHDSAANVFDEVSVKRSIFNAVKSFISKKNDKFRKSYGYVANNNMRKFVLWGTSNNNDFLKDYTAGLERRWMIIHVSEDKMNGVYLKEKMTKDNYLFVRRLWAQIMHMYNENKNFEMYLNHSWDDKLFTLQRGYKASNNEEYDTIINDLLEREYGFYDEDYIDVDSIVAQYKYNNAHEWCLTHNVEVSDKEAKSQRNEYIMKPEDRPIKFWGKIDRIQKTILYEIIDKLHIDYTKPTLASELKLTNKWNGCDNDPCRIGNKTVKAYWRKEKIRRVVFDYSKSGDGQTDLPF